MDFQDMLLHLFYWNYASTKTNGGPMKKVVKCVMFKLWITVLLLLKVTDGSCQYNNNFEFMVSYYYFLFYLQ